MEKLWVYLGQAVGEKVPIIDRFIEIDDQHKRIGQSFAFKKFKKSMVPGGIYAVEKDDEKGVNPSHVIFSGKMLKDQIWLSEIQTEHQIFLGQKKLKSIETKFKTEFKLTTDLQVLAIKYRDLYGIERLIFEWIVLAKLRELAGKA